MTPPNTSKPIRVGIVGLSADGGFAAGAHVPALRAVDGLELHGVSGSSAESAARAAAKHQVPRSYPSAQALAESDEIDLVVVAVKVPHHRELVGAALAAGKPVLCEWPLGNGTAEAEQLAAAARERALVSAVGLQARSSPALRHLRDLIADGYVGEMLCTTVVGSGVSWGETLPAAGQRYTTDPANGATLLSIPAGHTLDALCFVLGEFAGITAVTALRRPEVFDVEAGAVVPTHVPDQLVVAGTLGGGAVAALHYRGGTSRATNLRWEINGTQGDIVITGGTGHVQLADLDIRGARGEAHTLAPINVPSEYHLVPTVAAAGARVVNVANAYQRLQQELSGTSPDNTALPDFDHAVRHHRLLDRIEHATSATTER